MQARLITFLLLCLVVVLAACTSNTVGTPQVTETPPGSVVEEETAITQSATATSAPTAETSAEEPTATMQPTAANDGAALDSEATPTLPPIRATQQALADAVQLATRDATNEPIIAADDYVAITDQACRIVGENYVRDDFNGADWPELCAEYRAQAETIGDQEAFWNLMTQFIAELGDNHSRFVRPERFAAEFNLPQEGSGIPWPGLTLFSPRDDDRVLLWDVCDRGPAASVGLERGDVVVAVDGEPLSVPGLLDGAEIRDKLYAGGKGAADLTVIQGPGEAPTDVRVDYGGAGGCDGWTFGLLSEDPRIGYIRVRSFSGDADANIMAMLEALEQDEPLQGLVVDVRHNPGGNADKSLQVFTEGQFGMVGPLREDATQTIYRIRGPVRWNATTPMVVLTDGESHSAAEYFATGMQQSGRATLVGMPTAGNTEGITGFNLADGSLIRLAVMTLELPDGTTLEGTGVQPDVRVPLGDWGLKQRPDVQVQAALEFLAEQIGSG